MTTRKVVEAAPLEYDAEEAAELFRMVDQPKNPADAAGLEQFADEEEEEGEVEQALTEDAYSLLYTANFFSRTFLFAVCVVVLQGGLLIITFFDLVDMTSNPNQNNGKNNRMSIPQGATLTVTLAQFLGMILTVMLMAVDGDIVVGFSQLMEGYDADMKTEMPNATCFRWFATGVLQMLVGIFLLLDSFILSMQSSTVIDLVLNLTALYFIQEVDEIAFKMADIGILSQPIQEDCEKVKTLKQFAPKSFTKRLLIWKRVLLGMLAIGLLVPYFIVVSWQLSGQFMCDTLHIQFGDEYQPEMAYYSGRFDVQGYAYWDRHHDRARYLDGQKAFQLAYCNAEKAWTVSRYGPDPVTDNPCSYVFKSSETKTFDVTEVANSAWFYTTEDTGDDQVHWLQLACIECKQSCKPANGICETDDSIDGVNKEYCDCKGYKTGPTCELYAECEYFAIDERTLQSLATIPGATFFIKNEFQSLHTVIDDKITVHDRAVYLPFEPWGENGIPNYDINTTIVNAFLLFTGRRWLIYSIPQEDTGNLTRIKFIEFMQLWWKTPSQNPIDLLKSIPKRFPEFRPLFFSNPVNYGGPTYGAEPASVGWVFAQNYSNYKVISHRPDDEQPVSAKLLCSDCSEPSGACHNDGFCVGGACYCSEYYDGHLCERAVDCFDYDGCFQDLGECNALTRICDNCANGSFGNLCQYGPNELEDPFYCAKCQAKALGPIVCSNEQRQCNCTGLSVGEFCNIPEGWEDSVGTVAPTVVTTTSTVANETALGNATMATAPSNATIAPTSNATELPVLVFQNGGG